MTAIVGVLCRDGAVIGTDSSTTFTSGQQRTIEQQTEKLDIVADRIVIAGTGSVGLGQRFSAIVERAWKDQGFSAQATRIEIGKALSRTAIEDFKSTYALQGTFGALLAFPVGNSPVLCEFDTQDFQPEVKTPQVWYCSMGSTQPITDPFLALMREIFWSAGQPSVDEATFAVTWALDHAIAVNPGGVNGPARIAVLKREVGQFRARLLDGADLEEHRGLIEEAKDRLRELPAQFGANENAPDVPKR